MMRPKGPIGRRRGARSALAAAALLACGAAQAQDAAKAQGAAAQAPGGIEALRVCADPNNLPFSNRAGEGFENRLAEMIAADFGVELEYTWWAQRRGFVRNTLKAGACDVIIGVPANYELTATTAPYYRSTYVFVRRDGEHPGLASITDPRLAALRVGVHVTGDDGANPPPAHALGAQGIVDTVVGYMIYGDYAEPNPPGRIIRDVASGVIDVAAVWGPLGGYFAARMKPPLTVVPIEGTGAFPDQPFTYAIAMGVRRGDDALRERLDAFIQRRGHEIDALLLDYGAPLVSQGMQRAEAQR